MITRERFWNIILDVVRNPEDLSESEWEKLIHAVIKEISWKSMDSAPKDRPIIVWAYSSADWWKKDWRERTYMLVEWSAGWEQWYATAGAMGEDDGSALYAEEPIAWMELPDGPK